MNLPERLENVAILGAAGKMGSGISLLLAKEMARMSLDDGLVMQLHVGAYRNHNSRIFERFGLDKGADIQAVEVDGQTALHLAAQAGRKEAVALLIARGADTKAKDKSGDTPADVAHSRVRSLFGGNPESK